VVIFLVLFEFQYLGNIRS